MRETRTYDNHGGLGGTWRPFGCAQGMLGGDEHYCLPSIVYRPLV
jgi:hypothetical protein